MTSAQEFLTEFTRDLVAHPGDRPTLIAGWAKHMEAREHKLDANMFPIPPSLTDDVYRADDGTLRWKHDIAKGEQVKLPVLIHDSVSNTEISGMSEYVKEQKETLKEFLGDV